MTKKNQTSSLGRGLSSLINNGGASLKKEDKPLPNTPSTPEPIGEYREIEITLVQANPYQPRMEFAEAELQELSDSIKAEGLLQPILVRQKGDKFILIAGERRLRACQSLKMKAIPARVLTLDDSAAAVMSLVENLQREDLNAIDEAMGYSTLMREFHLTQEDVSRRVGKPRTSVANALRLIQLEQEIQAYIIKNLISVGHAKVILGLTEKDQRMALARKIIEMGLSVREAERYAISLKQATLSQGLPKPTSANVQSAVIRDLQKKLSMHFGAKVQLQHGAKKGKLVIAYEGNDDLQRILDKIGYLSKDHIRVA